MIKVVAYWLLYALQFQKPASVKLTAIKEGLIIAWERKIIHLELEIDVHALKYMS